MSKKKLNTQVVINELKGQSVFFGKDDSPISKNSDKDGVPRTTRSSKTKSTTESRSNELADSRSQGVTDFRSSGVPDFQSYEIRRFDQLRRLDLRLTWEQKRFLDDWEEDIRQAKSEGDIDNPEHRRITKNSIIRALLEIARQLEIRLDARSFYNERDLLEGLYESLSKKLTELRTSEVPE